MRGIDDALSEAGPSRRLGTVLAGTYRLVDVLAVGAAGAVYIAETAGTGRIVAVKMLHEAMALDGNVVERFRREAEAPNRVRLGDVPHPNVVPTLDAGRSEHDGAFYMVLPLLRGETLEERLADRTPRRLPAAEALPLLRPVIDAIAAAHRAGIVHRDLKPSNIFLVDRGEGRAPTPKVLDFGVAQFGDRRMTGANTLLGTPEYMAPEAFATPDAVDARADVWALGLVLYEMLSGEQPFEVPDATWIMVAIGVCERAVPSLPDDVPAALRDVVTRCLAKPRDERFADAGALLDALDAAMAD